MNKKTRLTILLSCVACFFIASPVLIAYSMGYRFDFEHKKIVATGGIYVRTFPAASEISIDSGGAQKPGIFSNSVFVQSLLPKSHTVSIKKEGYFDYFKTLPVKENEVTKLESVLLVKKEIQFAEVSQKTNYFSVSPNYRFIITADNSAKAPSFAYMAENDFANAKTFDILESGAKITDINWSPDSALALIQTAKAQAVSYYLFNPALTKNPVSKIPALDKNTKQIKFNPQNHLQIFYIKNSILYLLDQDKPEAVIEGVASYEFLGDSIVWLGRDGLMYQSDLAGKLINKLSKDSLQVNAQNSYQIIQLAGKTFVKEGAPLYVLNSETKLLEKFASPQGNYQVIPSPDSKNLVYWSDSQIWLYSFEKEKYEQLYLGAKITDCFWLNNDYIVLLANGKIIISEIDYRGNINTATLPTQASQILYDRQNNKIYSLNQGVLTVSEKITP